MNFLNPEPEFLNNIKIENEVKLIENPFACKISGISNRYFCKSQATNKIGNTDYQQTLMDEKGNIMFENELDPKLNFFIGKSIKEKEADSIRVDLEKFDYVIPAEVLNKKRIKNDKEPIHKEGIPISFLQIDNIEDGIIWYKQHYPKIPDDLLPIIARYHWGNAINKHTMKKEKKALKKQRNKKLYSIKKGEFKITWD